MNIVLKDKTGVALPVVIMVTTILMVLVGVFIEYASQEKQGSADEVNMTKALYLADAGTEITMHELEDFTWNWSTGAPVVFQLNNDPRQEVQIKLTGQSDGEEWNFESTGIYKDQKGQPLSTKTIVATVKKSLTPDQYQNGTPVNSPTMDLTYESAGVYYRKGDLELSGIYEGPWLIAVDGNVTISGDLRPHQPHKDNGKNDSDEDILIIICSGQVEVKRGTGQVDVWAVIYANSFTGNKNTKTYGKIIADPISLLENAKYIGPSKNKDVQDFVNDATATYPLMYKPVLVKWREKYPVF
ncbi:hypothetical protein [Desulforamulus putei]|uniref:hypothetical protein n=1 Tax=Desulforamulus putei TaxID=74701 RepID=UPI002FDE56B3